MTYLQHLQAAPQQAAQSAQVQPVLQQSFWQHCVPQQPADALVVGVPGMAEAERATRPDRMNAEMSDFTMRLL